MRKITFEETKSIELNILKSVHDFCCKNRLTYYLTFGTLLGAVRHDGFIPWDDDIDIFMPRSDYERFISTFSFEGLKCLSLDHDKGYPFSYAKVIDLRTIKKEPIHLSKKIELGVDIDIFPLDYYYEEGFDKRIYKKWHTYCRLWSLSVSKLRSKGVLKTILLFPIKIALRPFYRIIARKISYLTYNKEIIDRNEKREPIGFVSAFCTSPAVWTYKIQWFEKTIFHKFESFDFLIPVGYDELLRKVYGEYMSLPPVNKRISHHLFEAYYKY